MEEKNIQSITKDAKESLIDKNYDLLKLIFFAGNGMILHKQLIYILETIKYDTNANIKKRITELIKGGILEKKPIMLSKANMLIMNATAISRFTNQPTRNIAPVPSSDKTMQNAIFKLEDIINIFIPALQKGYNRDEVTIDEILTIVNDNASTLIFTQKHALQYYDNLLAFYPDYFTNDLQDDMACIRVERANQKNKLFKYDNVEIDPDDLKVKQDYDFIKSSMSDSKICQEFFSINNLINTSMAIEYIEDLGQIFQVNLAIFDNGNLSIERCSQLAAYVYKMWDRYLTFPRKVNLIVNVYCYDSETASFLEEDSQKRAEDLYGYSQNTRQLEHLLNNGVRFPYCEDNIHFHYIDMKITDHYGISPK